jgi:hypothetical protein
LPLQAETAELVGQARAEVVFQVSRRGGRNLGPRRRVLVRGVGDLSPRRTRQTAAIAPFH